MQTSLSFLFCFLFVWLAINIIYLLVFSVAGFFWNVKRCPECSSLFSFIVMIPAYKEDSVIINTVEQALKQSYPDEKYKVVVIADSMMDATLERLREFPIQVITVSLPVSSKAKALNLALNQIDEQLFDVALILDADNIMSQDFLRKMNRELQGGFVAVQGHRVAKNQNTPMAILDAVSEEINNHIFRKGHRILGFSSALIGSGMAFRFGYFKSMMQKIDSMGEDKEMELLLLRDKLSVSYADDALVFDEKVQDINVFKSQRRRWISAQLFFFQKYFISGWVSLVKDRNTDYFNKVFQTFLFPRVLLLGFTTSFMGISFFVQTLPAFGSWLFLWLLCIITLAFALPSRFLNRKLLIAILCLPKIFISMLGMLFKLKGESQKFSHTPHTIVQHENVIDSGINN